MVSLSVEGKVALPSPAVRGIGAAAVRLFRDAGARVAFSFRSAQSAADALVAETGTELCAAFAQDLATPDDGRALVRRTVERFGRLDILVVNHGVWPPDDVSIGAMSDGQWRSTLSTNLDSVFGLIGSGAAVPDTEPNATRRPCRSRAYCAGQLDGRTARRGLPRGLCRQQRRSHQHDERTSNGAGAAGHPGELRGSRLGEHGDVRANPGRP